MSSTTRLQSSVCEIPTKRQLSPPRQQLIEWLQEFQFGRIDELQIVAAQPILEPLPRLIREYKFASESELHSVPKRSDFRLKAQHVDFFRQLDALRDGLITLEVKHGLPFRMFVSDGPPRRAR